MEDKEVKFEDFILKRIEEEKKGNFNYNSIEEYEKASAEKCGMSLEFYRLKKKIDFHNFNEEQMNSFESLASYNRQLDLRRIKSEYDFKNPESYEKEELSLEEHWNKLNFHARETLTVKN